MNHLRVEKKKHKNDSEPTSPGTDRGISHATDTAEGKTPSTIGATAVQVTTEDHSHHDLPQGSLAAGLDQAATGDRLWDGTIIHVRK